MTGAVVLRLFSLLLGIILTGCSTTICLSDGQCSDGPSDLWYNTLHNLSTPLTFLGFALLVISIIVAVANTDRAGIAAILCALSLGSCTASGMIFNSQEGSEPPSVVVRREREEIVYQNRPEAQRDKALNAIKKLEDYRDQKLQPVLKEFDTEYQNYYTRLGSVLPELGVQSHEELIANQSQYSEQVDLLHRSAVLKNSIKWLNDKLDESNETLRYLNQNVWLLTKQIKLGEVAFSPEDKKAIDQLIAKTDAIVEDKTTPVERQDIAKFEQDIFSEIMASRT